MSDLKLVPRRKERLGDMLYGQILEQIVSGALKEGDKLPSENQICRSSQVSRPTVREALMRLHADGLVTTRQGSGTFVQRRPSDNLTRLVKVSDIAGMLRCLEVRMALEGQAAALAAQRRTSNQMDRIYETLTALQAAFESGTVPARTDFEFHLAVAAASGNTVFAEVQVVSCRNVLIYFNKVLQDRAIGLFRDALSRRGFLGLGSKEAIRFSAHAPAFMDFVPGEKWFQKR